MAVYAWSLLAQIALVQYITAAESVFCLLHTSIWVFIIEIDLNKSDEHYMTIASIQLEILRLLVYYIGRIIFVQC